MSGLSAWHKKQHKKELQKNKTARIAARDARVVASKTISEIDSEIRRLEKQFPKVEARPHTVRSKLDRLVKERKLVQEQAERQANETIANATSKSLSAVDSFKPLERPQVSVYFDPLLNPYGEPPPGQPRLYHRLPSLGGGVTRRLEEAWVPGEPERLPLPTSERPAPPPHLPARSQQLRTKRPQPNDQNGQQYLHPRGSGDQQAPRKGTIANGKSEEAKQIQSTATAIPDTTDTTNTRKSQYKPNNPASLALPEMPKPSAAAKRRGLQHDIWASMDEIQYEEVVANVCLDDSGGDHIAPTKRKRKELPPDVDPDSNCTYCYRDKQDQTQGPFTGEQMREWVKAGFFPLETLIRTSQDADHRWRPLSQFPSLLGTTRQQHTQHRKPQEAWNVRGTEADTVQSRIARLKAKQSPPHRNAENAPYDELEDVQARITRLKEQHESIRAPAGTDSAQIHLQQQTESSQEQQNDDVASDDDENIQHRIERLRRLRTNNTPSGVSNASYPVTADEPPAYPFEARDDPKASAAAYPVDAVYPVMDDYPVTDDYPITDDYPVTDEYPALEHDSGEEVYPVTVAYPFAGPDPAEEGPMAEPSLPGDLDQPPAPAEPQKRKVEMDKALVTFVPSHLKKRKVK